MIVQKAPYVDENGKEHVDKIETSSSNGFKILQVETGKIFDSAIDGYPSPYTYIETDVFIEDDFLITQERVYDHDIIMEVSE